MPALDDALSGNHLTTEVIVVDDGSTIHVESATSSPRTLKSIERMSVLELKRNLGHQRAITLGLAYASAERECDAVIVMDGDGEDEPADVVRLVEACRDENFSTMVFAKRSRRSEGLIFRLFYSLYRVFYKILTGRAIRIGNFSIVPRSILKRLVVVSEVWNHYAAGTIKARVPYIEVPTNRGKRLHGTPKMNFVSLVTHGLSAISVHGDVVGVRLLIATTLLIFFAVAGICVVVVIRLLTDLAIPGWATYVVALLLIILIQAVTLSLFFIFLVLSNRDNASFLPERDYVHFISRVVDIPVRN